MRQYTSILGITTPVRKKSRTMQRSVNIASKSAT
ncbi:unnamed protein product, partial [Rotaria sp. Silwood2]